MWDFAKKHPTEFVIIAFFTMLVISEIITKIAKIFY